MFANVCEWNLYRSLGGGAWIDLQRECPKDLIAAALVLAPTDPATIYVSTIFDGVFRMDPVCGDGMLDPREGCDAGDTVDGDGCPATCSIQDLAGIDLRGVTPR